MFGLFDRGDSDRGASLIMLSFTMVLLLGIAAVAVDLAGLRLDRRADRLATDAAVTAGVRAMVFRDGGARGVQDGVGLLGAEPRGCF